MIGENMKTEITIDGITYKVGDVLELNEEKANYKYYDNKILGFSDKSVFVQIQDDEAFNEGAYPLSLLKNWKIKKPKKKIVVEQWLNIYSSGVVVTHGSKKIADSFADRDRIACEYVRFEYEIDEKWGSDE